MVSAINGSYHSVIVIQGFCFQVAKVEPGHLRLLNKMADFASKIVVLQIIITSGHNTARRTDVT